jgi:hypothetical protein
MQQVFLFYLGYGGGLEIVVIELLSMGKPVGFPW